MSANTSRKDARTSRDSDLKTLRTKLRQANARFAKLYPGESDRRQPVHTVYGGAHLFKADSAPKLGALALRALEQYAPDATSFAQAIGLQTVLPADESFTETLYGRVVGKLKSEPVEDFRIDFEDGYGNRSDAEEDEHAASAAAEVASGFAADTLPPFIGIRIKPLSGELFERALRTLDIFVSTLVHATKRRLPPHVIITIPKVTVPEHVASVANTCALLERKHKLGRSSLALELMIETPQAILRPDGTSALRTLVSAGAGRVTGAHLGTYDYTALCGITASYQRMSHPACDFAKHMMQVALAQTGIHLSDGATNIMPIGPHRASPRETLTSHQLRENREAVHRAWTLHFNDVRHSLVGGFYQGWDLHPAQLPTRYAAVFSFFLAERSAASTRLRNFVEKAAQATVVGDVFDDAATGQGLLNFFLRGVGCGAITLNEAGATGLTQEELRSRSFLEILQGRRSASAIGSA